MIVIYVLYSTALQRRVAVERDGYGNEWLLRPRQHDYYRGASAPRYPLPVTSGTAALSMYHQDGSPTVWPYRTVKAELSYLK